MIFDREHECMSRADLRKLQEERLKALVERVYVGVPFYTDLLDKHGVKPESKKEGERPMWEILLGTP